MQVEPAKVAELLWGGDAVAGSVVGEPGERGEEGDSEAVHLDLLQDDGVAALDARESGVGLEAEPEAGKEREPEAAEGDPGDRAPRGDADRVAGGGAGHVAGHAGHPLALLHDAPRAATVRVTSPCAKLWTLDRKTFHQIMVATTRSARLGVLEFLCYVPIFSPLSIQEREQLADAFMTRQYATGEMIIREGDEGNHFFIVEQGSAQVYKGGSPTRTACSNGNGVEVSLLRAQRRIFQGDYFGEIALITKERRQATIIASEPTVCLVLDGAAFTISSF